MPRHPKSKEKMSKAWWLFVAALMASWMFFAGNLYALKTEILSARPMTIGTSLGAILRPCLKNVYTDACWNSAIGRAVNTFPEEQVLKWVDREFTVAVSNRAFCHPAAHLVGQHAFLKQTSVSAAFASGVINGQVCASGYFHGVLEGAISVIDRTQLLTLVPSLCAPFQGDQDKLNYYNCLHGLGHGFVNLHEKSWLKALDDCMLLTGDWEQRSCASGVFMQNVIAEISSTGHASDFRKDDIHYPCSIVDTKWKNTCYLTQVGHWLTLFTDAKKIEMGCRNAAPYERNCFISYGNNMANWYRGNEIKVIEACTDLPSGVQNCINGAAMDYVYHYHGRTEADQLCAAAPAAWRDDCLKTITTISERNSINS